MASAKVNERSTKTEIWDAYRQLVHELQNKPMATSEDPAKLQKMTSAVSEAKAALMGHFDATIERLITVQQAYQEADQDLLRRKGAAVDTLEQNKRELEAIIETVRKQWEQEKADQNMQRVREEETYAYDLNRKRRDSEETYAGKIKEREAEFAARTAALTEREQVAKSLTDQVASFPTELEKTVKAAREETTKELKAQSASEVKDVKQALEHEKSILALKLQSAEASLGAQAKQIVELQRQLDASAAQLKEMAIAVIQSKNTTPAEPA